MSQKGLIILLAGIVILAGWFVMAGEAPDSGLDDSQDVLYSVDSIAHENQNHIHGIGYDSENERLYIATHFGLFAHKNNQLYQVGESRDDYMGFSLNQRQPNIIYTSGHPQTGGNLGVMKSEDSGVSWEQISLGSERPADFHSMAISYANPDILYGIFQGQFYRSNDSGYSWERLQTEGPDISDGFCWHAPCISADPQDDSTVYVGTTEGLVVSSDFGQTWEVIESDSGVVVVAEADPSDNSRIFAFTENYGLAMSADGGQTWEERSEGLQLSPQELVLALTFDPSDSSKIFIATNNNQVFTTEDSGESWQKIL